MKIIHSPEIGYDSLSRLIGSLALAWTGILLALNGVACMVGMVGGRE